jgi:CYTH domain-containing protein
MKYAHIEREIRFLPVRRPDVSTAARRLEIHDRYLDGTRLRLRVVDEPGLPVVRKLGQNIRVDGSREVAHTTLYLEDAEHALLAALPGRELCKTRHLVPTDGLDVAVEVFHGPLEGLVLVEVDLGDDGAAPDPRPAWWGQDVTGLEAFTGGALAGLDADGLTRVIVDLGRSLPTG